VTAGLAELAYQLSWPRGVPAGRTPPTLVSYNETDWPAMGVTKNTPSVSWQSGDFIVVLAMTSGSGVHVDTVTATGLTFAAGTEVMADAACWANSWTATAGSSGSSIITGTRIGDDFPWGVAVWLFRGSDGAGNRADNISSAKTVSLVRSQDESAVIEIIGDWDAGDPAGVSWTPTQDNEREAATHTYYSVFAADWTDEDVAATVSYGITGTASAGNHTKLALEILGTGSAANPFKNQIPPPYEYIHRSSYW
jgi:hypothetical protein